ncbi:MAG: flavin-containing monooxygenase [Candidatus Eisenbacteria bacterium]
MMSERNTTHVQTVVIGGGQAGLSVGYHLARRKLPFVILDASERIGDAWRMRWDSLRLFTPARYAGLAGMRFPGRGDTFPTKQQMADYLETYARHFELPVRSSVRVDRLARRGDGFVVTAGDQRYECENVVVAMADHQVPRVPSFASGLDPGIVQLHSHAYRNPTQLAPGDVLVVGVGNSGADIALEVARTHRTWLSGRESGQVPFAIESPIARHVLVRLVRALGHHVLNTSTPIGRRLRPTLLRRAAPLVRVKIRDLRDAGVERVSRVVGVRDGRPRLADDRTLDVANVIWCTGYEPGFTWIDMPVFDDGGLPRYERGVVAEARGLFFVGLHFLYAMTSDTLFGIDRDARHVTRELARRVRFMRETGADHGARSSTGTTGPRPLSDRAA